MLDELRDMLGLEGPDGNRHNPQKKQGRFAGLRQKLGGLTEMLGGEEEDDDDDDRRRRSTSGNRTDDRRRSRDDDDDRGRRSGRRERDDGFDLFGD